MSSLRYTPRELPDLRLRMTEFWDNPDNNFWAHVLDEGNKPSDDKYLGEVAGLVRASLADSELFYIDGDLANIARTNKLPITDYGFMPWDLPAPQGFMYFADGMSVDWMDTTTPMVLTWNTCESTGHAPHGSLDIFVHAPKDQVRAEAFPAGTPTPRFDEEQPDFVLANNLNVAFAEEGEPIGYNAHSREMAYYLGLLFSTCHLMRQALAEPRTQAPERAVRRRHQRAELGPPDIRVVSLRRSERPETTGESAREFHHRFIVRGHWRRQWYPSIEAHRPIWIAPFVKGPEDAPLLGGEKVYTLTDPDE